MSRLTTVALRCDSCNAEISEVEKDWNHGEPEGWFQFTTRHEDWGNDSIDSHDEFDACSASCYLDLLAKVVEDYEPTRPGFAPTLEVEVDGMDYAAAVDLLMAAGRRQQEVVGWRRKREAAQ